MFQTDNTDQAMHAGNIKRCALGVSLALGLGGLPTASNAALSTSTLSFVLGQVEVVSCLLGTTPPPCTNTLFNQTDIVGSWFAMGPVDPSTKTPIGSFNGIVMGTAQAASDSHSGLVDGSESPNIDKPWNFFSNTGMHQSLTPINVLTDAGSTKTLDMSGWNVNWNGIASIPLETLTPSTVTCDTAGCSHSENYELDGTFNVTGAGFTGVTYTLHLEGLVAASDAPPIAIDDIARTIVGNAVPVSVTDNDVSGSDPKFSAGTVMSTNPANGSTTDNPDNTVTYAPTGTTVGMDSFDYTVNNANGTSNTAEVIVDVQNNVPPVANDDSAATTIAAFENAGGMLEITVLKNDTDANNGPGLAGGINPSSVEVLSQPPVGEGTCTENADGTITYAQTAPFIAVSTSCTYQVMDIDNFAGGAGPLTSTPPATVAIDITPIESDWDNALNPDIIPFLLYTSGVQNDEGDSTKPPKSGSYFTMDVSATTTIHVLLEGAAAAGMVIGHEQVSGNSHGGVPDGLEPAVIEKGWNFFGNTGMAWSRDGGIIGNEDGTLQFAGVDGKEGDGRYMITWNGIPAIDLGGSPIEPEDLGFGIIQCDTVMPVNPGNKELCEHGDFFELAYGAHVPQGDPSGFGGVLYGLHTVGTVAFLDGRFQTSDGIVFVEERQMASEVTPDADMEPQCVGDCFDYTITEVTPGSSVSVVIPLAGGVPDDVKDNDGNAVPPELRVFDGESWHSFITSAIDPASSDTVKSARFIDGGDFGLVCPPPGDDYGPMTAGDQCLEITIEDDGPNDKDETDGTIKDPSGLGIPKIVFIDKRTSSSSSGCSITTKDIAPSHRSEWWLLAGFVAWLGWRRRKTDQH